MPVESADSQSTLPHAQAAELAEEPSDTEHGACLLHLFSDCLQNIPVESADSQSALPHAQDSELAEDPSIERQSQYRPAMDPLVTPENMLVVLALLSTHAGAQNGGWLKLYAPENTAEKGECIRIEGHGTGGRKI